MNNDNASTNPKLIVAVQMLCIGIVLLVLGVAVVLSSPVKAMSPLFRTWSVVSNGSIILVGVAFTVGGVLRFRRLG
ncbi:MAG: hypothetical protein FJY80_05100 [Candidatus Aminicenantes bacterium]|nr:hypothetical protein [Candidatus Aminicenantes bacterium]